MPQLNYPKEVAHRERGAVLVVVAAFATLLTFAMGGFLGVARNMVNQEIGELNDDKAFLAAESGLLVGTRWLRESNNWSVYQVSGYPGSVYSGAINGFNVSVSVVRLPNGQLAIQSNAGSVGLPYQKQLSWTVRQAFWNNPGVFMNDCRMPGKVGGGGINNEWFDGPVHSNTYIHVSSVNGGNSSVRFINGKVTVHNNLSLIAFPGGDYGHYGTSNASGNNYDFGIWVHDAQVGQANKVDQVFANGGGSYASYKHSQDYLYVHKESGQTILLPSNVSATQRAILNFFVQNGTGKASYYYYDNANTQYDTTFNVNNQVIRIPNDISVLGTVKGQVTVVTDADKTIYPAGDIQYDGFVPNLAEMDNFNNVNNYGLGGLTPLNSDVLALVSGGDIMFIEDKYELTSQSGVAVLTPVPSQNQNTTEMIITAQLFAIDSGHCITWATTNANQYNYQLRALGTRAIDVYEESHNAQGNPGNFTFKFLYDTRFSQGLIAPGSPTLRVNANSSELFILNTTWYEENVL